MLSVKDNKCLLVLIVISVFILINVTGQHHFTEHKSNKLKWCTISLAEKYKCQNFSKAIEREHQIFDELYHNISCYHAFNSEECIKLVDNEAADIMSLDAGEVFNAGRYHSLVPFMQEAYSGGFTYFYAVAVIKKNTLTDVRSIRDLRGKKACFAGVGTLAGWTVPIYTLSIHGGMDIIDCNNHVKNAINFFGKSCAVNALVNQYNPIGDNSDKLCSLCIGKIPGGKCTSSDPYAGYEGAFRCLLEAGDIAFLKHTTVDEMTASKQFNSVGADRFELLCTDGQRMPLSQYRQCNWAAVPSNALVISSGKTARERKRYQEFFSKALSLYSHQKTVSINSTFSSSKFDENLNRYDEQYNRYDVNNRNSYYNRTGTTTTTTDRYNFRRNQDIDGNGIEDENGFAGQPYEKFDMFESERYGGRLNLLFQDSAERLVPIPEEDQFFGKYLNNSLDTIYGIRKCPVGRMTFCVTSEMEMEKCVEMRTALKTQLVKPEMICYKGHSHINCMQAIQSGVADVTVLDASDVYTAGLRYGLIPFQSEVYDSGAREYYVVAVAKEQDADTEITYLRGKSTCHTGINTAAGWVYPMAYLISNGWIRPYGCDSVRAAAEYFNKSCIPGALSNEYNTGVPYDNLCHLCHGASFRNCRRDASEDYYGHSGALRCLIEGGGDVAFVKHTSVSENSGGKNREWWARNTLDFDFELLCPDGTRAYLNQYAKCNLGKVKANAIVTRGGEAYNETEVTAYINLFTYAQQYYGRKDPDNFSFSMYYSNPPYHDLIFQDTTRQLRVIEKELRRYDLYLGSDFMRARRITDYSWKTLIQNTVTSKDWLESDSDDDSDKSGDDGDDDETEDDDDSEDDDSSEMDTD